MKLIKIPSSLGGLGKSDGSELAPDIVIKELKELFLSESGRLPTFDIEEIEVEKNISLVNKKIYEKAVQSFNTQCPIFLGGDHSITLPIIRAFCEKYENPGIIIFDAHPDAMDNFETHEDLLPGIIENNLIKKENILLIGTRTFHKHELEFLRNNKIRYFTMNEIVAEGIHDACDTMMSIAKEWDSIYLSIDIDVIDPAFAPGTGYLEPAGLTSRELIYLIHRLKKINKIKGADLVEINPKKDLNNMTSKLGAKILVELC